VIHILFNLIEINPNVIA
jgi:hypothetical protein